MIPHTIIEEHFELTEHQKEQFAALFELYSFWNSQINVISRKDMDNFYLRHVLHSLSIAKMGEIQGGDNVLDIGCGGGFPLIPLAILMPDVSFTGVDSIGKKIKVVNEIVEGVGLRNVETFNCRAESLERQWDWVVSRAVAPLSDLMAWSDGKWREGMLLLKGGDLEQEIMESNTSGKQVGFRGISEWFDDSFFETKGILSVKTLI